ncbi:MULTISPECIES: SEC-C metal-binding domain-containing protein [Aeromonas]|nr:SEC-C domain-containing protein [Aeromonas sobria]
MVAAIKIGRNELCPCGSGKMFALTNKLDSKRGPMALSCFG